MQIAPKQQQAALEAILRGSITVGLAHERGEFADSAYARQPIAFEVNLAEDGAAARNTATVRFPACARDSAASIPYYVLFDASGHVILQDRLMRPLRPAADEEIFFRAGEIEIRMT